MAFSGSLKLDALIESSDNEMATKEDSKALNELKRRGAFKKPVKG